MNEKLNNSESPYLTIMYLLDMFQEMASPKMKVAQLVKKNDLIPIKRGLYLHGQKYKKSYSKLVLSTMVYGPSAISFEYALSFHGLIPERVETLTCICFKRNKSFDTPVGTFAYKYIAKELFPIGLEYHQTELGNFFMASPEKAICDMAYFEKLTNFKEAEAYLFESLRIDRNAIKNLSFENVLLLERVYNRKSVSLIVDVIGENR